MCSTQGTETIRLDKTTRRGAAIWAASLVVPTAARKAGVYVESFLTQRVGTNSLRPVTVRQVLNASQPHSDAPFTFDNAELSQGTLVAWIQNISRNATNVSYTLDDGTGQLDVRQWIDNSMDEGAKVDEFHTNEYVRVLGEVKSFNNKRSVTAASIARLEDHNEYLFHQLDVIYTHLQLSKSSGAVRVLTDAQSTKASGLNQDASAYDDASVAIDASSADLSHLTPLQRRIYGAITAEAPDYPEGVDVQQIVARCKNADPAQIQCVTCLLTQGRHRRTGQRRVHLSGQRRDTLPHDRGITARLGITRVL